MRLRFFWAAWVFAAPALSFAQQPLEPGHLAGAIKPPLTPAQKLKVAAYESISARSFVGAAIGAAVGQADDSPREWGQGTLGYGRRFVSGFGGNISHQFMTAGLETALHEEPRYFLSQDHSFKARTLNVLKQSYLTRTDSGATSFAYARWIGALANGQFVNLWQPHSTNSPWHGVERGFITIGADTGVNLIREFFPLARSKSVVVAP